MRFSLYGSPVRRLLLLLSFVTLLGAVGCGKQTATVSGKVTIDGEPLKGGNVTFTRNDGKPTTYAVIAADGSYKMENVPVGNVKVCVETKSLKPAQAPSLRPGGGGAGGPPIVNKPPQGSDLPKDYDPNKQNVSNADLYVPIPDKYSDPAQTDLQYEVKSGSQEHAIQLTKK